MGCLGLHFALGQAEVKALRSKRSNSARLDFVQEQLEEDFWSDHPEWVVETDKAWDAIHRALTDGGIAWSNGSYPLNQAVLGGEVLYGNDDYIISLKLPQAVHDIAAALRDIREDRFRTAYFRIDAADYCFPVTTEDYEYTWHWFTGMREFYYRAADVGRHVLFTADQ